jgi:YVTN family beta-propeller protein
VAVTPPADISIGHDGTHVYVTNVGARSVSVIDTATNTVAAVGLEFIPVHVSISRDRAHARVTNTGSNSV